MKKLSALLLSLLLAFSIVSVDAKSYQTSKLDKAIQKISTFYKKQKTLTSPDEIIAVESLGLEAESSAFDIKEVLSGIAGLTKSDSLGDISKGIIALALTGNDPYNYKNKNYVSFLTSKIKSDGSISGVSAPNYEVYVLLALESVNASQVSKVAKHLASTIMSNGAFWYEYNGKIADDATTAWCIEALTIASRSTYKSTITKAVNYLKKAETDDGSFDSSGWGANADTQSAVLEALSVYNKSGLIGGTYDKNQNPWDYLLSYQLDDGSFKSLDWSTYEYVYNAYTTLEGARALGTYKNGSFISKAVKTYKNTIKPVLTLNKSKYTYDGKDKVNTYTVKSNGQTIKTGKVTKKVIGTYTVKVTLKGRYQSFGTLSKSFTIIPGKTSIVSLKGNTKAIALEVKKLNGGVVYEVAYKKSSAKKWSYKKVGKKSVLKNLAKKTKYQVKVRTVKGKLTSDWTKVKTVKTK